jgi:hypothetical protein
LIKLILSGNAAIWGKYVWTNIAAIKDGSIKRMIFPPCPTMLIPFCFLKMLIMMRLFFEFSWNVFFIIICFTLCNTPLSDLFDDTVLAGDEAARLQDVDGRLQGFGQ